MTFIWMYLSIVSAAPVDARFDELVDALFREQRKDRTTGTVRPDQRLADALVRLAVGHNTSGAGRNNSGSTEPARPQLSVTVTQDWLTGSLMATGVTDSGILLAPSVLVQLACDADILSIVLGGHSQPLDVVRERRTVTDAQRRALVARDGVVCGRTATPLHRSATPITSTTGPTADPPTSTTSPCCVTSTTPDGPSHASATTGCSSTPLMPELTGTRQSASSSPTLADRPLLLGLDEAPTARIDRGRAVGPTGPEVSWRCGASVARRSGRRGGGPW
jgi:hypothetical protein